MTLEQAKEILKDMKESMEQSKKDITIDSILKALEDSVEAIDTVLKALEEFELLKENDEVLRLDLTKALKELGLPEDTIIADELVNMIHENYIPKEKVRETLKDCQNFIDEFENNEKDSIKEYKQLINDYDVGLKQGVKAEIEMWKKNKMEYVHKRNILMELLGE